MRESIGGSWLFSLVIIFILLFTAFLSITINYSKAFKIKNSIIDIIEEEEGFTHDSAERINNYLNGTGYNNRGTCRTGFLTSDGDTITSSTGARYRYCVRKHDSFSTKNPQKAYYEINVFFSLNLPIFGDFFTFRVTGETTEIFYPADCEIWGNC